MRGVQATNTVNLVCLGLSRIKGCWGSTVYRKVGHGVFTPVHVALSSLGSTTHGIMDLQAELVNV